MTSSSGTSRVLIPQPPSSSPPIVMPRRGEINSVYGLYLGGSPLDDLYKHRVTSRLTYRYATQCRNDKTISLIEQQLMNACESVTTLKFDGRLKATVGSSTEIGKERFLTLLGQRVEEHGQETFYHAKSSNNEVVNIIENSHNFTTNMLISEFEI
jgi:hypothetical protein